MLLCYQHCLIKQIFDEFVSCVIALLGLEICFLGERFFVFNVMFGLSCIFFFFNFPIPLFFGTSFRENILLSFFKILTLPIL